MCSGTVKHLADEARKPVSYGRHRISGGGVRGQLLQAERDEVQPGKAERDEVQPGKAERDEVQRGEAAPTAAGRTA
ncbi:hypothetical protein ACIQZO_28670 [Streptomyces sp. NPDC097617]|uniref:hypothetical protein n=1 Tax=Streptomyces sp. NPDC097617 TaxID=3366091 RepID=UPI00382A23EB